MEVFAEAAMTSGPTATVSDRPCVAVSPNESVTWTVNEYRPAVAGVPDSTPVLAFRVRPGGRLPPFTDQVNGPVPPVTASVSL